MPRAGIVIGKGIGANECPRERLGHWADRHNLRCLGAWKHRLCVLDSDLRLNRFINLIMAFFRNGTTRAG